MPVKKNNDYAIYIFGYLFCFLLTITAYLMVENKIISGKSLLYAIGAFAVLQFFIQMRLFLHLGQEDKPRYQLVAFNFMVLVVLILVFGSIWIMQNLDYHHPKHSHQSDTYIIKDEGINTGSR